MDYFDLVKLSAWTQLTYTFYDCFFFHHTSLKILVITKAMPAFFASSVKKITSVKNETYLCPSTYLSVIGLNYSICPEKCERKTGVVLTCPGVIFEPEAVN